MGGHSQRVGSRRQVWNGTAMETSGGLKRSDLFKDKYGNLKSKKASKKAKRSKNLKKAGYTTVKGKFGAVRISGKPVKSRKASKKRKSSKKSRKAKRSSKKRGGSNHNHPRSRKVGGVNHNHPRRRKIKQMGGVTMSGYVWDPGADGIVDPTDTSEWFPGVLSQIGTQTTQRDGTGSYTSGADVTGAYSLTVAGNGAQLGQLARRTAEVEGDIDFTSAVRTRSLIDGTSSTGTPPSGVQIANTGDGIYGYVAPPPLPGTGTGTDTGDTGTGTGTGDAGSR
jgi:hypothetical protein